MFSSASSVSKNCNSLTKDSLTDTSASSSDSGISVGKIKKLPKRGVYCSQKHEIIGREDEDNNYFQMKNDWSKNGLKKRSFEQSSSGSFTSEEYLEASSKLQSLARKEKELKIAITYEKLRKEQPVFLDLDVLHEKIAEQKKLLEEARNEQKIKTVMCTNLQFANTLQRIIRFSRKTKGNNRSNYSETRKTCMQELLKKKKELNRNISTKRQEIAEIDETILKLKKHTADSVQRNTQLIAEGSSVSDNIKENKDEKLKRLIKSNEKFRDRIHVLSRINQSLATYLAKGSTENENLSKLVLECEKVSRCTFDHLNDVEALLGSVCAINL